MSNRLNKNFDVERRCFYADTYETDEYLAPNGRIMDSYLSEHMCEGWLEGYLLTGRHGFFASYESFIRVVDSMVAQHAKWLKVCNQLLGGIRFTVLAEVTDTAADTHDNRPKNPMRRHCR